MRVCVFGPKKSELDFKRWIALFDNGRNVVHKFIKDSKLKTNWSSMIFEFIQIKTWIIFQDL